MTVDEVTAVLVTRGDVDMQPIIESLPFRNVVVWDNSGQITVFEDGSVKSGRMFDVSDLAVYGRYAGIEEALFPVVYVQDDDVILPADSIMELLAAYESGRVVCNMPERFRHEFYGEHALVGFGAVFDRELPQTAFHRVGVYSGDTQVRTWGDQPIDMWSFRRTCDVVFTALTPRVLVDVPYVDREFASDPNRMWRQPGHVSERARMLELALSVKDAAAA